VETLEELEAEYERVAQRVSDAPDVNAALTALSPGQRALVVLLYVDATINNGGFAALFYIPPGEAWREALGAAELIEADGHAALLRRVGALCPGGEMPKDHDERNAILESMPDGSPELEELKALDSEWYAQEPSLEERFLAYAKRHPYEFGERRAADTDIPNPS
jgi:hypothetical protein